MIRLLRLAAIAAMVSGLAAFVWSVPWRPWIGSDDLVVLPDRQTDFIFNPPWAAAVVAVAAPLVLLLVYAAGAGLAMLALAGIVERLDPIRQRQSGHAEPTAPVPSSPPGSTSIWNRLASARLLRITAVAVIATAVATAVMQYPWWLMIWRRETVLRDTYFVIDPASILGSLAMAGIAALVLVALARILDRLDDIQRRVGQDD